MSRSVLDYMKINIDSSCISRKKCFLYTILLFILAGIFEIGGGYLVWLWLRENKEVVFGLLAGLTLAIYGIIPTFQPLISAGYMQLMEEFLLFPSDYRYAIR